MKQLRQISVVGAGLLGSSITLTILRSFSRVKTVIYGHRAITRQKAGKLGIADIVVNSLAECVADADLVNATDPKQLRFAGKGFIDTSRVASGPANIWTDTIITNAANTTRGIDKVIKELTKLKGAIKNKNRNKIEKLLENARSKRAGLINYKMKKKELL